MSYRESLSSEVTFEATEWAEYMIANSPEGLERLDSLLASGNYGDDSEDADDSVVAAQMADLALGATIRELKLRAGVFFE